MNRPFHTLSLLSSASLLALGFIACDGDSTANNQLEPTDDAGTGGNGGDVVGALGGQGGASENGTGGPRVGGGVVPCISDKECKASGKLCDPALYICASCLSDADCGEDASCSLGACESLVNCVNSLGCGADQVCVVAADSDTGICQECGADTDCSDDAKCKAGTCRSSCASDKDCVASGELCSPELSACVECVRSADCGAGQACSENTCIAAACAPGSSVCAGDSVLTCREDGQGFLPPVSCGEDTCSVVDGAGFCGDSQVSGVEPGLVPDGTFEMGSGLWAISGGPENPMPTIVEGAVCESYETFTLGWPSEGDGLTLEPGEYKLSFALTVGEADEWDAVEAKIAFTEPPYYPEYLVEQVDNLANTSKSYELTFQVEEEATSVGVAFNVSGMQSEICFDDIRLVKL